MVEKIGEIHQHKKGTHVPFVSLIPRMSPRRIVNVPDRVSVYIVFPKEIMMDEKNSDEVKSEEEKKKGSNQGYAIAIGILFSVAFGIVFDNMVYGIAIGLCFAMAFGLFSNK